MNNLTDEQQVPIDRWFAGSDSIAVRANPGVGKTFLLSHLLNDIPRTEKTMVISFSNNGVDEIRSRCNNPHIMFSTAHKIGAAINNGFFWNWKRGKRGKIYWEKRGTDKYQLLINMLLTDEGFTPNARFVLASKLRPIVDLGRMYLCQEEEELYDMCRMYNMHCDQQLYNYYSQVIETGRKRFFSRGGSSDVTDAIWLPYHLELEEDDVFPFRYKVVNEASDVNPFGPYYTSGKRIAGQLIREDKQGKGYLDIYGIDNLVIDEAQDMSAATIHLATMLQPKRIFMVGDPRQSVMNFAGSHFQSFDMLKESFEDIGHIFDECTIKRTFRFGPEIADYVTSRHYVNGPLEGFVNPDILPNEDVDSKVIYDKNWIQHVVPGSTLVVGRIVNGSNSVVIPALVQALQYGFTIKLQGINIVGLCSNILTYMKNGGYRKDQLDNAMEDYISDQIAVAEEDDDTYLDATALRDELSFAISLLWLIDGNTAYELETNMRKAFGTKDPDILFSTIHRGKGFSWKTVVVLDHDKFPYIREDQSEEEFMSELWVWHVAITRASHTLVLA